MSSIDLISERALRFARTFQFMHQTIVSNQPASEKLVLRFGTPGSTEYREILIHMDWGHSQFDIIHSASSTERQDAESFLKAGVDLLVISQHDSC